MNYIRFKGGNYELINEISVLTPLMKYLHFVHFLLQISSTSMHNLQTVSRADG